MTTKQAIILFILDIGIVSILCSILVIPSDNYPSPENYYTLAPTVEPNRYQLELELDTVNYTLGFSDLYQENYFDCSEMSAYLEWYFAREGYEADIMIGHTGEDALASHAWVRVHGVNGSTIIVEATACCVVPQEWYESEYHAEYIYSTVNDASVRWTVSEFDWWHTKYANELVEFGKRRSI